MARKSGQSSPLCPIHIVVEASGLGARSAEAASPRRGRGGGEYRDADRHVAFHSDCQAEFTTIDELTEPYGYKCDFIKTDTEGYEPKVLAGMQRTLDHSPNLSIMMEWSPEQIKQ